MVAGNRIARVSVGARRSVLPRSTPSTRRPAARAPPPAPQPAGAAQGRAGVNDPQAHRRGRIWTTTMGISTNPPADVGAAKDPRCAGAVRHGSGEWASFSVVAVRDFGELERHAAAWEDLAAAAVEPNVFYEPWMLLPALRAYGRGLPLTVVLVFAHHQARPQAPPLLCGLFPLECRRRLKGLPVRVASSWYYAHCYLGVPLVRAGLGHECLEALCHWLATDRRGAILLECFRIAGEGAFHHL